MAGYKSIVHNRTVLDSIFEVKWIIDEASLSLVEETFISCSLQVVLLKVYVCGLLVPLLYGRRQTVYPEVQTCQKCSPIASKKGSLALSETVVSAYFFKSFPLLLSFSIYFPYFMTLGSNKTAESGAKKEIDKKSLCEADS